MRKKYRTLREIQRTHKSDIKWSQLGLTMACASLLSGKSGPWSAAFLVVLVSVFLVQISKALSQIKGLDQSAMTKLGWATAGYGSLLVAWLAKPELPLAKKCDSRDALRRLLPEEQAEFLAWFDRFESTLASKSIRLADYPLDSVLGAFIRGTSPDDFVAGKWKQLTLVSIEEVEAALELGAPRQREESNARPLDVR